MQKVVITKNSNSDELNKLLDDGWTVKEFKPIAARIVMGGACTWSDKEGNVYCYYLLEKIEFNFKDKPKLD